MSANSATVQSALLLRLLLLLLSFGSPAQEGISLAGYFSRSGGASIPEKMFLTGTARNRWVQ